MGRNRHRDRSRRRKEKHVPFNFPAQCNTDLGIIGTVTEADPAGQCEWTIVDFLSLNNGTADQNSWDLQASFNSPIFGASGCKWQLEISVATNRDIFVCLIVNSTCVNETGPFVCFLGFRKSDGMVEDRSLTTDMTFTNSLYQRFFCLPFNELDSRRSTILPSGALTVTCSIRRADSKIVKHEPGLFQTTGTITKMVDGQWEWKIDSFFIFYQKSFVMSPFFFSYLCTWEFDIINAYESILVYLRMTDTVFGGPFLCSVGIRKSDGTVEKTYHSTPEMFTLSTFKLLFRFPTNELYRRKAELFPSGTLTVVCSIQPCDYGISPHVPLHECIQKTADEQIGTTEVTETQTPKSATEMLKSESLSNLSESLKHLMLSEEDNDVVLNVKGREFKAHRGILKARSPVLSATLQHDMIEKNTGVVEINDCDPESFSDFLLFLYAGQTAKYPNSNHALQLYKTAHKYDVSDLQKECLEYLKGNLTVENVCDIMSLALQYDEDELYAFASGFFFENSTSIVETSQFVKFMLTNVKAAQKLVVEMSKAK